MASFGFSPSDLVNAVILINSAYRKWRDACGQYSEVTNVLSSCETVFERLKGLAERRTVSETGQRAGILELMNACHSTVTALNDFIVKYESLGKSRRKNWDRIRFGGKGQEVQRLQGQLATHIGLINAFLSANNAENLETLQNHSSVHGQSLNEILSYVKEVHARQCSEMDDTASQISKWTYHEADTREEWRCFRRELIAEGFNIQNLKKHERQIRRYLRELEGEYEVDEDPAHASFNSSSGQSTSSMTSKRSCESRSELDGAVGTDPPHEHINPSILATERKEDDDDQAGETGAGKDHLSINSFGKGEDPGYDTEVSPLSDNTLLDKVAPPVFDGSALVSYTEAVAALRNRLFSTVEVFFGHEKIALTPSLVDSEAHQMYLHGQRYPILDQHVYEFLENLWDFTSYQTLEWRGPIEDLRGECQTLGEMKVCSMSEGSTQSFYGESLSDLLESLEQRMYRLMCLRSEEIY